MIYELYSIESSANIDPLDMLQNSKKLEIPKELHDQVFGDCDDVLVGNSGDGADFLISQIAVQRIRYTAILDKVKSWLEAPEYGTEHLVKYLAALTRYEDETPKSVSTVEELRDTLPESRYLEPDICERLYP